MSLVALFSFSGAMAQNTSVTAGGDVNGLGGSVSFSLGQVFDDQPKSPNGSVSQGVQQPYEIYVVTALEQTDGITLSMAVYPNPTTDILFLKTQSEPGPNLHYCLFDNTGRLVLKNNIIGVETKIEMGALHPSVYLLKVMQNNIVLKVFKIIKAE